MIASAAQRKVLTDFLRSGKRLSFSRGESLVRPGEAPPGVFLIEKGLVKCYDITKYGEENLLVIRHKGELLGMTNAITGDARQIMYTAIAPTTVWLVETEKFQQFMRQIPAASLPVLDMVTEMYRINSERILNLEYRTVRERLISFLLTHANRFGRQVDDGILIDVPLRHQDIASSISATRETTGRAISALEQKGFLKSASSYITLCDVEALRKYLET